MTEDKPRTAVAIAGSTPAREGGQRRVPLTFRDLAESVALAEETGYEAAYVPDHGVWDPFSLLAALGQRTSRIRLAPGVVTISSRDHRSMAAAVSTLHRVSGRRAILGLGSGPERRIVRVAEYLHEVRALLDDPIPLHLAALGPRMTELAGEAADAVLLNWCTPDRVAQARAEVARGADRAGRDPREVQVAVYVRACLSHDDERAVTVLGEATAMYAGIPAYRRQLDAMGLGREADRARGGEAPASLVRALCVWGTREEALERLAEWRQAGADVVVVYPVTAQEPGSSLLGTIMAVAPDPAIEH
jgi:alkanesulfonate monooxygenase SsuD/methylene tetrahydromethanopterin reductase-like flavin-dependent oxidoreductase (luciferase family)